MRIAPDDLRGAQLEPPNFDSEVAERVALGVSARLSNESGRPCQRAQGDLGGID